ncbi:hypothetical protein E1B28_006418 [Marasmius oreades]|uniref:Uncharacterized protein n=1 Tax=Marasmius oreades TaxID=181124 RepID=A0A9P7UWD9_9AGAR|nr:uncharacterized protein E1B28_006418 [Marasmius oreades]KAG7095704.1 hypothetical protein E1B28_006418 [Marasmius oreades]
MKFISFSIFSVLIASAFAQRAEIGLPHDGAQVTSGSQVTVRVDRPNFLSSTQEVVIVLGFQSCPNTPCHAASDGIGEVLYNGPYNPTFEVPSSSLPPYQNFTVTIPASTPKGAAQLSLSHFSLVGASRQPTLEIKSVNVAVV